VRDLERLDAELARARVERRSVPLGWPSVDEVPARLLVAGEVELDDRSVLALDGALQRRAVPLVELDGLGQAPPEHEVREANAARELADLAATTLWVLDHLDRRAEARALAEVSLADPVDLDPEEEARLRIDPCTGCHGASFTAP
jgi:hypothetical protein